MRFHGQSRQSINIPFAANIQLGFWDTNDVIALINAASGAAPFGVQQSQTAQQAHATDKIAK